jgi:ribosome-associated protein
LQLPLKDKLKALNLAMTSSLPDLSSEFTIKAIRSGGKGGQNVNKVSSKAELHFNLVASLLIPEEIKEKLIKKLSKKLSKEGELVVVSQSERSLLYNKRLVITKLYEILEGALKERKKRKATKPSKAAVEKRLKEKKLGSEKKKLRQDKKIKF